QAASRRMRCLMGTWAAGPFENDAALDYLGDLVDRLENTILDFVAQPLVDDTLDAAFAAVALLNILAEHTPTCLRQPEAARGWREVFLRCYDEQIDRLKPDPTFKVQQREALMRELDQLVAAADRQARSDREEAADA